jgi:hypothetical protein
MTLLLILLYVLSLLLIWQFVGYPLLMGIIALTSKPENKEYVPTVCFYPRAEIE